MWSGRAHLKHFPRNARRRSRSSLLRFAIFLFAERPDWFAFFRPELVFERDTAFPYAFTDTVRRACSKPSIFSLNTSRVGLRTDRNSLCKDGSDNPIYSIMQIRSLQVIFTLSASSSNDKSSSRNSMADCPSFWRASKKCLRRTWIGYASRKVWSKIAMHVNNPAMGEYTGVVPLDQFEREERCPSSCINMPVAGNREECLAAPSQNTPGTVSSRFWRLMSKRCAWVFQA